MNQVLESIYLFSNLWKDHWNKEQKPKERLLQVARAIKMYNLMELQVHATESCSERSEMQTRRSQYDTLEQPFGARAKRAPSER